MKFSPEQLKQFKNFLEMANNSLTKEDFASSFKALIDFVKKVEKDLTSKIEIKTQDAENQLAETNQLYKETIQKIEADNESTLSNVKKWALESVGKLFAKSKINEKLSELDIAIERVKSFIPKDGDNGKDGNTIMIVPTFTKAPHEAKKGDLMIVEETGETYIFE